MKRKIALLLATVMTLSLVPMNVFAASEAKLSDPATVVPEKTVLIEDALITNKEVDKSIAEKDDNDDVEYVADGTDLVITVKDEIQPGDTFRLELENAKWFFRSDMGFNLTSPGGLTASQQDIATYNWGTHVDNDFAEILRDTNNNLIWETDDAMQKWDEDYVSDDGGEDATYNVNEGVWGFNSAHQSNGDSAVVGTYFRTDLADDSGKQEIPYMLSVSPLNDAYATIEILADNNQRSVVPDPTNPAVMLTSAQKTQDIWVNDQLTPEGNLIPNYSVPVAVPGGDGILDYPRTAYRSNDGVNAGNGWQIRIPLVTRTLKEADVKVVIIPDNQTAIDRDTLAFGIAGKALTNTYVNDPDTARDQFEVDKLIIKESRINGIVLGDGDPDSVFISAPAGFEFDDPDELDIKVGVDRGLTWGDGTFGYGAQGTDWDLTYKNADRADEDKSVLELTIYDLVPSSDITGAIFIEGISFYAEDNAPFGDIMFEIENVEDGLLIDKNSKDLVTEQKFLAGHRVDWTISLTTKGEIPELVNGRYETETEFQAQDAYHQTANVVFKENATNAWWSERETVFTLPEGVKFRKVEIVDSENLLEKGNNYDLDDDGPYYADGKKDNHVKIDGNTMTWSNLDVKQNEKAMVEMEIWVSIESGFEGDVTLSVEGGAIPEQNGAPEGKVPSIVIAKQISPVTISTKVTDVKIGYQYQETADIMITETKAGNLMKGKTVNVSVSDLISSDMAFSPDVKVAVTAGDMKIQNVRTSNKGFASTASGSSLLGTSSTTDNSGTIQFDIKTPSSKPSTITLSNVSVKIDRTVPYSNDRPYQVVVWGTAIAQNFGDHKDEFQKAGLTADYARVVSAPIDQNGVLTQEVRVTEGESYYTVNGVPYDMDATAYISEESNSMMVPIRFVSNAFGLGDEQIKWDDANDTVTLLIPNGRTVQYKVGSSTKLIDGIAVTMYSPDMLEVMPENVDDRVYVPFRAIGDDFGVEVAWDDATRTAIYNPGAALDAPKVNADEIVTNPTSTPAPATTVAPAATVAPTATPAATVAPTATPAA